MNPMLRTERLLLRPFEAADAAAVHSLCGNWDVAHMLSRVPHPYTLDLAAQWIASHGAARSSGAEHVFCVALDDDVVGAAGLERTAPGTYEIGYWIGEPWWGRGFATEAARRLVQFAFVELGVGKLT